MTEERGVRHDWTFDEVREIYVQPMNDLLFQAHLTLRKNFDPNRIQVSTLLNIKTGGCAEDCGYCSQSAHHEGRVAPQPLMTVDQVSEAADRAQAKGMTRLCMGAAWRNPRDRDMPTLIGIIRAVKQRGLQACMTLGMLTAEQAKTLREAGLDYYNHNLDTAREYYPNVVSTRTYEDRLETLKVVREAGIHVCCGGIVGMGESRDDRIRMVAELSSLPEHPQSVPINLLVKMAGTPMEAAPDLDLFEFVRTVATARIVMPRSFVRLSAGRATMNEQMQALCFFAGCNSIFYGDRLLTVENAECDDDLDLLNRLGIVPEMNSIQEVGE
jgi:biotin synthase